MVDFYKAVEQREKLMKAYSRMEQNEPRCGINKNVSELFKQTPSNAESHSNCFGVKQINSSFIR